MFEHSGYDGFRHCVATLGGGRQVMWAGPFPAGPRQPGRLPSRSCTPAGKRETPAATSRTAAGRKSAPPKPAFGPVRPKIARDSVIHLEENSYPFEDGDLGRVPTASADD